MDSTQPGQKVWAVCFIDLPIVLWNVILDDQQRAVGSSCVAAIQLQIVSAHIIVVIQVEPQSELGDSGFINIGINGGTQDSRVPSFGRCIRNGSDRVLAGSSLEVS